MVRRVQHGVALRGRGLGEAVEDAVFKVEVYKLLVVRAVEDYLALVVGFKVGAMQPSSVLIAFQRELSAGEQLAVVGRVDLVDGEAELGGRRARAGVRELYLVFLARAVAALEVDLVRYVEVDRRAAAVDDVLVDQHVGGLVEQVEDQHMLLLVIGVGVEAGIHLRAAVMVIGAVRVVAVQLHARGQELRARGAAIVELVRQGDVLEAGHEVLPRRVDDDVVADGFGGIAVLVQKLLAALLQLRHVAVHRDVYPGALAAPADLVVVNVALQPGIVRPDRVVLDGDVVVDGELRAAGIIFEVFYRERDACGAVGVFYLLACGDRRAVPVIVFAALRPVLRPQSALNQGRALRKPVGQHDILAVHARVGAQQYAEVQNPFGGLVIHCDAVFEVAVVAVRALPALVARLLLQLVGLFIDHGGVGFVARDFAGVEDGVGRAGLQLGVVHRGVVLHGDGLAAHLVHGGRCEFNRKSGVFVRLSHRGDRVVRTAHERRPVYADGHRIQLLAGHVVAVRHRLSAGGRALERVFEGDALQILRLKRARHVDGCVPLHLARRLRGAAGIQPAALVQAVVRRVGMDGGAALIALAVPLKLRPVIHGDLLPGLQVLDLGLVGDGVGIAGSGREGVGQFNLALAVYLRADIDRIRHGHGSAVRRGDLVCEFPAAYFAPVRVDGDGPLDDARGLVVFAILFEHLSGDDHV